MPLLHLSSENLDDLIRVLIPFLVAVAAYLKAERQKQRLLRHEETCKPRTCSLCQNCPFRHPSDEGKPDGG